MTGSAGRWWRALLSALALTIASTAGAQPAPGDLAEADRLEKEVDQQSEEGRMDVALDLAERVLAIRQKALPPTDARLGSAIGDVGALRLILGDPVAAEPLLVRAVEIIEKAKPDKKEHATALSNLGALHRARGEIDKAIALGERALAMLEKAYGPDSPEAATQARGLATVVAGRDLKRAVALATRARDAHKKAKSERDEIRDMVVLAHLIRLENMRHQDDPYALLNDAVKRTATAFGPNHPMSADLRITVAEFLRRDAPSAGSPKASAERWERAHQLLAEAEKILTAVYGPKHLRLAEVHVADSLVFEAERKIPEAVERRRKANEIEEAHLSAVLASGSEAIKRSYLEKLGTHAEQTVSLHFGPGFMQGGPGPAPGAKDAAELALTTVLRRKGRALEAVAGEIAALRGRMGDAEQRVLDELTSVRSELATLVVRGPGSMAPDAYQSKARALEERAAALENEVSAKSAAYRERATPVTIAAVQSALPPKSALVEIVRFNQRSAKGFTASGDRASAHYVAYVLRNDGAARATYLADASTVDTIVAQLRKGLADPNDRRVGDPANRLWMTTMNRIERILGDGVEHLILSPDGALNLVPFGAMSDGKQWIAQKYALSYVSSGRDLTRFGSRRPPRGSPTLIADPAYEASTTTAAAGGQRAADLSRAKFSPLPGTREEAAAIGKLVSGAQLFGQARATEAALKAVHGPELLHVATHGFFLSKSPVTSAGGRGLELESASAPVESRARPLFSIRDPLLRAGLALAGANGRGAGTTDDDGILTALEASALDLDGTKLVVLSACETGLGEVQGAEGVFGLRRAFVMAGAETLVMSLWKVDDAATKDLMTGYYQRIVNGGGRAASLREVQLAMLSRDETAHPYYWAAFIVSGDPSPLRAAPPATRDAKAASGEGAKSAAVPPGGSRGCGCDVPASRGEGGFAAAVALLLASLLARRRR